MIQRQNDLKQLGDRPLHGKAGVSDILLTLENRLTADNFDNSERIWQQWVEMFLKKYARKIQKARQMEMRANMPQATDLRENGGQKVTRHLAEVPYTTFLIGIIWVSNGTDNNILSKQRHAPYTDVRHREELIDIFNKQGGPKEPYILTSMLKCKLG